MQNNHSCSELLTARNSSQAMSKFETVRSSAKPLVTQDSAIHQKLRGVDKQPRYSYLIKRRNGSLVKVERRHVSHLKQSFGQPERHQEPSL